MVAQLVRQEDGSYDYVEVTEPKKSVAPNLTEFEAYEGDKKDTELVSSPTIEEQTERVIRETPGQYKTTFDEKTGQFKTEAVEPTTDRAITYTPGEVTPESTEMTALEKVMSMPKQEQIDYSEIMKDAYQATQPTFKDQLLSSALDVGGNLLTNYITKKMTGAGGDIMITNMTQHVLGGTLSGQLASAQTLKGINTAAMVNPYTMAAAALMTKPGKKIAKKAVKTIKKATKSVVDFVTGGSVICTELNRQDLISDEDYKIHWDYTTNKWNKDELKGYWIWAMPTAKKMKTNKLLTKFWHHIMKYKIQYIKYNLGKAKFTLKGYIYNLLVEQISLLISKFIPKKKIKEVLA
mgnify:FL=1